MREEARTYLEKASGNLAVALRDICGEIKPVGVIKCRFSVDSVNIYGLLLFIFNSRLRKMMRHAAVSGCNPSIFETDMDEQWFAYEKNIYSRRLADGALREISQKIEQSLLLRLQQNSIEEFYGAWDLNDTDSVSRLICSGIEDVVRYDSGSGQKVKMQMSWQRLNLRQFKYLTDTDKVDELPLHLEDDTSHHSMVFLETSLADSPGTLLRAGKLEPGDVVFTTITDRRDIGVYLSHLLGARKADEMIPLSANIEDIKETSGGLEVVVRFGPLIMGRALIDPRRKVGVIKNRGTLSFGWSFYAAVAIAAGLMYYFIRVL